MKKILLILACGLIIGCAGSNYGANAVIKGKIVRPGPNFLINGETIPPGPNNTDAFVHLQAAAGSSYTGRPLLAQINPDDGTFSISINLGVKEPGPPVVYAGSASFDLFLKVNGDWWQSDTTSGVAEAFMEGVIAESGKETDIGTLVRINVAWK